MVWLAQDRLLARQVAVKEFVPPVGADPADQETMRVRTLREARTAARLSHPNVVTIYDVVEDGSRPWIVMELIAARSLRDIVHEHGALAPRQAAIAGLQVLDALRAAHQLGILHRDVKPGNVLVDGHGRAVLADFGIARAQDSPEVTATGVLLGSPCYIAPERARGERGGPEADLWSLGATLYAVVEGHPPYDRGNALATLTAIATQSPDPPRRCGPLWPVIRGLLRKDPALRLDAATAADMLRQVAGGGDAPHTEPLDLPRAWTSPGWAVPAPGRGGQEAASPLAGHEPASDLTFQLTSLRKRTTRERPHPERGPQLPAPASQQPSSTAPASRRWLFRLIGLTAVLTMVTGILLAVTAPLQPSVIPAWSGRIASPGGAPGPRAHSGHAGLAAHRHARQPGARRQPRVPAGYRRYRDSTGFSLAVPDSWRVLHRGGYVYLVPPDGTRFLLIGQTAHPQGSPLGDWVQHQADWRHIYPGYHQIRLGRIRYPQAEQAADVEFSYYRGGVLTHVLIRVVLVTARHAYALYWSTPASSWNQSWHLFNVFARTFQPASPLPRRPAGVARGRSPLTLRGHPATLACWIAASPGVRRRTGRVDGPDRVLATDT